MILIHLAALVLAQANALPPPSESGVPPALAAEQEAEADEIVVRAVKGKCRVQLADRLLTDREFDQRTDEWAAGKAVRVVEPRGANYKCLAKIMFRLNDKGVRLVRFVDRADEP
jgi:biopolymer transport protein ExbD